ncbi:MAG: AmmeMemoRadiSam system protein B [Propionibacteriaceae bacterium]|jgi:AmmeMemoRadiSam system protein B|nr:AmmeMemoRadiSam system protein B [Propionibacteriaceae bacterium]
MTVRRPAVAGLFYPGDPGTLRAAVAGFIQPGGPQGAAAIIVPHAGYRYSGAIAGLAYTGVAARHVVLLGPCHRYGIRALALPGADALATPLGEVAVWREGAERAAALPHVVTEAAAHREEHSLEVQLPFLQVVLPGVPVLPLAVGQVGPEAIADVLDGVWDEGTLVVVSSDLSHYHPYAEANLRDAETIAQILALRYPLSYEQACGADPVSGLLAWAVRRRLRPQLLGACNSGDTAGDHSRVVGYAAFRFEGDDHGL